MMGSSADLSSREKLLNRMIKVIYKGLSRVFFTRLSKGRKLESGARRLALILHRATTKISEQSLLKLVLFIGHKLTRRVMTTKECQALQRIINRVTSRLISQSLSAICRAGNLKRTSAEQEIGLRLHRL
jgi:hypothetical protein